MQYLRSYRFAFEGPNWKMNLLGATVCVLIPAIGNIVLFGYVFEVVEALHSRGDGPAPDFDFNRFVKYLVRGLWPFLVYLVVMLPVMLVVMGVYLLAIVFGALLSKDANDPTPFLMVVGGFVLFALALSFVSSLLVAPMMLRAGLSQEFALLDCWVFARDFIGRVGKQLVLVQLFLLVSSLLLTLAGLALCFVGIYPATALFFLADAHLLHQLYRLYLERGGDEVPLPVEPVGP